MHGCRIEPGMTSVIVGLTRNPCRAGDTVVIGAWIAGQARNDGGEESCRLTQRTTKQSRVRLDCSSQSGHVAWAVRPCGPAGCTRSRRRIASCARCLARESCLNTATKERREFFRGAARANRPGSRWHRRVPRATCPRGAVQLHAALPSPDREASEQWPTRQCRAASAGVSTSPTRGSPCD